MRNFLVMFMLLGLVMVSSEANAQGAIDNTSIGLTTAQAGKFTNLETNTLEATTSIKLGTETITNFSGIDDDKVKASSGDTAPGFLDSKIVAGSGVTVTAGTNTITIAAPPANVEDSADGVEITFARESESAIDLNGTALFIGSTDPTVTLGGQARTVLSKGTIPNTTPALQQVVVDLPFALLDGNHKLKLSNTSGFSEGLIPLSSIGNDQFVKLLLHADGTGNAFTDSSASAKAITAVGNVTQSSAQSQFGGKSILFDGNGDRLTVASSSDFDLGSPSGNTNDFTLEAWIRTSAIQLRHGIISRRSTGQSSASTGGWFVNLHLGKLAFGVNIGDNAYNFESNGLTDWPGYLDEFRFSKGIARFTGNFTPPAAPYN